MPNRARFSQIDESNLDDHFHLTPQDRCYFVFEYTSGRDYKFSKANSLISNLKKEPSRKLLPEYRHKKIAIRDCSQWISQAVNHRWLESATVVPVPPSKAKDHSEYDDRILQICNGMPVDFSLDVREIVTQKVSLDAAHKSGGIRSKLEELLSVYQIDENYTEPVPERIVIVDDVLTAGTHFRAMATALTQRFPNVQIVGVFIARRVFPPDEDDEI